MKTLKLMMAASLVAGTVAIGAAPANAAAVACRIACHTGGASTGYAYWVLACPAGIITAAMAKNWKHHKELTAPEAWTCGLQYWWNEANGRYGH
jgi:hypothetical protein